MVRVGSLGSRIGNGYGVLPPVCWAARERLLSNQGPLGRSGSAPRSGSDPNKATGVAGTEAKPPPWTRDGGGARGSSVLPSGRTGPVAALSRQTAGLLRQTAPIWEIGNVCTTPEFGGRGDLGISRRRLAHRFYVRSEDFWPGGKLRGHAGMGSSVPMSLCFGRISCVMRHASPPFRLPVDLLW